MGMFDYIRCEVPLPDGWQPPDDLLQTKDFNCEMVVHIITKEGRLMLEQIDEMHVVPESERPHPGAPGLLGMMGMLRSDKSIHDSNFHGIVNFYDLETTGYEPDERYGPKGRPIYKSHNYHAKFTDGQLVGIELLPNDD